MAEDFFEEQSEQSQVKAAIVSKYFWAWAKIIIAVQQKGGRDQRIAYIDLFAGPGRYCTILMNPCSSNQFEQAPEEGSDFPRQRPTTAHAPIFLPQPLPFQGVATIGVRRTTLRVVPRAVPPVAEPAGRSMPRPQRHPRPAPP